MSKTLLPRIAGVPVAAALLALAATPAAARTPERAPPSRTGEIARQMGDPVMQAMAGEVMARMAEAMLAIDVSPMAGAAEAMGDKRTARKLRRSGSLGAMAGGDARRIPDEVRRKAPVMMGAMAGMAGAMEAMLPQLARVMDQVKDAIPAGIPGAGGRVDPDEPAAGEAVEEPGTAPQDAAEAGDDRPEYPGDPDQSAALAQPAA